MWLQARCSAQFSTEVITQQRENCVQLEKGELDMVVFGQLQAFTRAGVMKVHRGEALWSLYSVVNLCVGQFMPTLSLKRYEGLVPRVHGNLHRAPHNRLPFDDVRAIIAFIKHLLKKCMRYLCQEECPTTKIKLSFYHLTSLRLKFTGGMKKPVFRLGKKSCFMAYISRFASIWSVSWVPAKCQITC